MMASLRSLRYTLLAVFICGLSTADGQGQPRLRGLRHSCKGLLCCNNQHHEQITFAILFMAALLFMALVRQFLVLTWSVCAMNINRYRYPVIVRPARVTCYASRVPRDSYASDPTITSSPFYSYPPPDKLPIFQSKESDLEPQTTPDTPTTEKYKDVYSKPVPDETTETYRESYTDEDLERQTESSPSDKEPYKEFPNSEPCSEDHQITEQFIEPVDKYTDESEPCSEPYPEYYADADADNPYPVHDYQQNYGRLTLSPEPARALVRLSKPRKPIKQRRRSYF